MFWEPIYAVLLLVSTTVVYFSAIGMKDRSKRLKTLILTASIIINLGILVYFKYYDFIMSSITDAAKLAGLSFLPPKTTVIPWLHAKIMSILAGISALLGASYKPPILKLITPIGISFYTFQALSYSIDVYRGKRDAEKNFTVLALFVSFFPLILAGPIERSTSLLPQFYKKTEFNYRNASDGLKLMAWGLFQKMVIAEHLLIIVNAVYGNPKAYSGFPVLAAIYCYVIYVYFDFAGYSNIAIGISQVMGYEIMTNFRRPFLARSMDDFWRRWHISLISWLRDYLYIPLGGNRVSRPRWYLNMILVFTLSGLWHGAKWTFVTWGFINGVLIAVSNASKPLKEKLIAAIQKLTKIEPNPNHKIRIIWQRFSVASMFAFGGVFFAAQSMSDAFYVLSKWSFKNFLHIFLIYDPIQCLFIIFFCAIAFTADHIQETRGSIRAMINKKPLFSRWAVYVALCSCIALFGFRGSGQFLYFRF
jgi:D-alanyl-lipoteichoic acid acyltransferase DltB (MBOAT superfamily)